MINKELSIIIPVKDENESLPILISLIKLLLDYNYEVLDFNLNYKYEIIIVHDEYNDKTIPTVHKLQEKFSDMKILLVHNNLGKGVINAVKKGIENSNYDIILLTVADEIFPIVAIPKMLNLILYKDYDLVSGTRYLPGGKTIGGSIIERILSKIANKLFKILTNFPLTDSTTGIKMFKKQLFQNISLKSNPVGWAFAYELVIKAHLENYKLGEVPYKMINRLFGGTSSFEFFSWVKEYSKWFFWGVVKIRMKKRKYFNNKINN